jgi:endonuclease YncB( thermonuclease family)
MSGCNFQAQGPGLAALVVLFLASTVLGQEAIVSDRIVGITDNDTIKALAPGNQILRVRLSWIDAPESSQAFGQRSKQQLRELVFGRPRCASTARQAPPGLDRPKKNGANCR